ncbi:MAG: metal-sensing transcriptional repressor [Bacilli bacterium]|jgi:DNA-binding FrmR family transcriptional regulator
MLKDKKQLHTYLNIANGQINGIKQMIDEDKYCIDISNQIMAAIALLKKANHLIISNHLQNCVRNSLTDGDIDSKIEELEQLFERLD